MVVLKVNAASSSLPDAPRASAGSSRGVAGSRLGRARPCWSGAGALPVELGCGHACVVVAGP